MSDLAPRRQRALHRLLDVPKHAGVGYLGGGLLVALVAAILYGLFWYVFPWVSQFVNPQQSTVGG